jgi:hypothetical protein
MASVASPYGLRPVRNLGGRVYNHGISQYRIASGYATSIFCGDLVTRITDGTITKCSPTTDSTTVGTTMPIGVFMGVEYVSSTQGLLHRNFWTASTTVPTGTFAKAYVVDDPDALFEIQADESLDYTAMGANGSLIQTAGSTTTGISAVALDGSAVAATAAFPVRIVDFVDKVGFSALGDAFTDVIVKLNSHFYRQTTGI